MNTNTVTIQDCLEMMNLKSMRTVINDGKVVDLSTKIALNPTTNQTSASSEVGD